MKIWISDTLTSTHRLVKFNCEEHSGYDYLGDLDDKELEIFLLECKPDIDVEKNINLIKYYGYLHIFVIYKKL